MSHRIHDFLTVSDVLGALRRRCLRIFFMTGFLSCLVVVGLLLIPNKYQSDALLYVRMGRGTVSLDPATTAASQTISLMDRRQSEINSVREMLRSRIVLDRAARQVGVDRILAHDAWWNVMLGQAGEWSEQQINGFQDKYLKKRFINKDATPSGMTAEQFEAQESLELAVKRLSKALSIDAAKDSYTLGVSVRAYDAELARDICEAIVTEYRKVHIDAHSLEGSLQFFEAEYALNEKRLADLEAKLRDEKNRTSMMTISGKQDLIHQEIRQLQADKIKASSELAAAQGRDAEFVRKISGIPEKLDMEKTAGVANAATDTMRNQLFELEMMEKELTGKYAATHPLVIQVRSKLKEARSIFDEQSDERVLSRQALNPIRQELELDRLRNLSALEGWKAQMDEIDEKLKLAENKASQLNNDELNINEMERNVQLARNDLLIYGRKREEARLLKQLDVGNFSDISVPQPPMLVYKHVSPQRSLLLVLGVAGSLVVSCCLAIWRDANHRARSILAATDAVATASDRANAGDTRQVRPNVQTPELVEASRSKFKAKTTFKKSADSDSAEESEVDSEAKPLVKSH